MDVASAAETGVFFLFAAIMAMAISSPRTKSAKPHSVSKESAKASEKDDLQAIKGVGPFIEEKLNALGIYTFSQVSKMTSELEDQVNEAIEFFPGRVKRDEWANQAKELLEQTVKGDA